jgi:hypothetical protein
MIFNIPCKVDIMAPEEKIAIKRNETNRKRFLEKFFMVPAGMPFIP